MTIAVTAATGQLGQLVVSALLERGVPAAEVVAVGRNPEKLAPLAASGVQTRVADYAEPATLVAALAGVDRVLLISSPEVGQRLPQHLNVVAAAKEAGVSLLAYTSVVKADTSSLGLAADHLATERAIAESGLPYSFLRNGWYTENYTGQIATQVQHGAILGSTGDALVSPATRADFAEAAAAVLTSDEPADVYELGGRAVTMDDIAAAVTEVTGTQVVYTDLPADAYGKVLTDAGVPAPFVDMLVNAEQGAARGDLHVPADALEQLIGRPATSVTDAVRAAAATLN